MRAPVPGAEEFAYAALAAAAGDFGGAALLGEGAFSRVYEGYLPELGMEVAIKRLTAAPESDEAIVFRRECALMARLRHPNLLQLIGVAVDGPQLCLVTVLMGGGSLRARLTGDGAPLTLLQRAMALRCVARGLVYLHTKLQSVHRDVKPSNILFDAGTSRAVLADYGLSREVKRDSGRTDKTQVPAGTAAYMSPEVCCAASCWHRCAWAHPRPPDAQGQGDAGDGRLRLWHLCARDGGRATRRGGAGGR